MNYRHAYHAGNFADCFKHALLVALLEALARKPAPYFVLDTHAGAGRYDLQAAPALSSREASAGILRLIENPLPVLSRYLGLVKMLGLYPGSPALIRAAMREHDRLACCELHPDDATVLRRQFRGDPQVEVHERSGWEALKALLPPREKRGLILVDPSFESRSEFLMLEDGLLRGHARFRNGIIAGWYPVKQMAAVRNFHGRLRSSGIRDIVAVELHLRDPTNSDRLSGCGLVVINPPYQFEEHGQLIVDAVLNRVGENEVGAGTAVIRLTNE